MFASLGFNVDLSGLDKFRNNIKLARTDISNLGKDASTTSRQLSGMAKALDGVANKLDKVNTNKANGKISSGYTNVAQSVNKVDSAFQSIATNQKNITRALGKIHASVKAGEPIWDRYRTTIQQTKQALLQVNNEMKSLRANSTVNLKVNRGGSSSTSDGGTRGASSKPFDISGGGFLRSMLPAVALAGGLPTLGFAAKEVVNQGREQTKMESILLATSKDTQEFGDSLKFVREEALRLGLSSVELGKSFAQISMSAGKALTQSEKKEMFLGVSEFMMSMGTNKDDQKGIFRAMNQMFSNTRILQEEINQLSERGIPATMVWDAAKKAYNTDDIKVIKKMQEQGKLDPAKVLPILAETMRKMAHETGAYDKMMQSSIVKQGIFFEKLSQMSKKFMDSGVDVFLGKLFSQATKLLDVVDNLGTSLNQILVSIKSVTNGKTLLAVAIAVLLLRFGALRTTLWRVAALLTQNAGKAKILSTILTGTLGRTVALMVMRFGLWGVAIYGVVKALSFLGDQLKKSNKGEWTFFDEVFSEIEIMQLKFEIFFERQKLGWSNLGEFILQNPINWFKSPVEKGEYLPEDLGKLSRKQPSDFQKKMKQTIDDYNKALKSINPNSRGYLSYDRTSYTPSMQASSKQRVVATLPITINVDGRTSTYISTVAGTMEA